MLQTLVKHAGREGPHVSFSFDKLLNLFAYDSRQCTSLNCIVCMRVAEYGAQNEFLRISIAIMHCHAVYMMYLYLLCTNSSMNISANALLKKVS